MQEKTRATKINSDNGGRFRHPLIVCLSSRRLMITPDNSERETRFPGGRDSPANMIAPSLQNTTGLCMLRRLRSISKHDHLYRNAKCSSNGAKESEEFIGSLNKWRILSGRSGSSRNRIDTAPETKIQMSTLLSYFSASRVFDSNRGNRSIKN